MVAGKNKRISKGKNGGKKKTVEPFSKKESSDFISHDDPLMASAATIAQPSAKPVKRGKRDGEKEIDVRGVKKNKRKVVEAVKEPEDRKKSKKSKEPETSSSEDLTESEEEVSVAAIMQPPAKPVKKGKSGGQEKINVEVCTKKNKREVVKAFKKSEDGRKSTKQEPETSSSEDLTQSEEEFTVAAIARPPRKLVKKGKRNGVEKINVEVSTKKNKREAVEAIKKLEDEKKLKKPKEPETSSSEDLTESEEEVAEAAVIQPPSEPIKKRKRDGEEKINVEGSTKKHKREIVETVKKPEDGKKLKKLKEPETNRSQELMESNDEVAVAAIAQSPAKSVKKSPPAQPLAKAVKKGKRDGEKKANVEVTKGKTQIEALEVVKKPVDGKKSKRLKKEPGTSSSEDHPDSKETAPSNEGKSSSKVLKKVCSHDEDDSSDENSDDGPSNVLHKQTPFSSNTVKPGAKTIKMQSSSDEDDGSDESSEDEPSTAQQKKQAAPSNGGKSSTQVVTKVSSSDEDDSSDESFEEGPSKTLSYKHTPFSSNTGKPGPKTIKMESSHDEYDRSDGSSDDEPPKAQENKQTLLPPNVCKTRGKNNQKGSYDDEPSKTHENKRAPTSDVGKPTIKVVKKYSSSDEDESSDDEPSRPRSRNTIQSNTGKSSTTKIGKKGSSNDDSASEHSLDDMPLNASTEKAPVSSGLCKRITKMVKKDSSSVEDESSEESSDDDSSQRRSTKDIDVKMEDAPSSNVNGKLTSSKFEEKRSQPSGSKTLFVGNLSFEVGRAEVEEFFKKAGEIIQVRLATTTDCYFMGFGHVVFATEDAVQKALQMNGEELLGRAVKLELAQERSVSGKESISGQRGGEDQTRTVFIKGFDTSLGKIQIQKLLKEHFGSCGDISRLSIPKELETGAFKGIAFMDFKDPTGFSNALKLHGSNLEGYILTVDRASTKTDGHDLPRRKGVVPLWALSSDYRQRASIPSKGKRITFEIDD